MSHGGVKQNSILFCFTLPCGLFVQNIMCRVNRCRVERWKPANLLCYSVFTCWSHTLAASMTFESLLDTWICGSWTTYDNKYIIYYTRKIIPTICLCYIPFNSTFSCDIITWQTHFNSEANGIINVFIGFRGFKCLKNSRFALRLQVGGHDFHRWTVNPYMVKIAPCPVMSG